MYVFLASTTYNLPLSVTSLLSGLAQERRGSRFKGNEEMLCNNSQSIVLYFDGREKGPAFSSGSDLPFSLVRHQDDITMGWDIRELGD